MKKKLVLGITGASSVIYGIRFLEVVKQIAEIESHLVLSAGAQATMRLETDWEVEKVRALADQVWEENDLTAPISSGSHPVIGMVVLPMSMKTMAAIAHGYDDNLIARAAGVQLKEGRKLILCPRETPMHQGHLRNMLELSQMGAVILPPMPAFYQKPQSIEDLIDHTVGKILDQFKIDHQLFNRWGVKK